MVVYGGKDLPKSQVLSSEWKHKRVREDKIGDSEDGEDELPCVIGGEREGDSTWRGSLAMPLLKTTKFGVKKDITIAWCEHILISITV